jgi:hypothetical protein
VNGIRARPRRLGVLTVLVAFVLAGGSAIRVIASAAGMRISFPMSAGTITICDRDYRGGDVVRTAEDIVQRSGLEPVVVDPGFLASCPAPNADGGRPCSRIADGPCSTVVFVRVGPDAYAEYSLVGGP